MKSVNTFCAVAFALSTVWLALTNPIAFGVIVVIAAIAHFAFDKEDE